MDEAITLQMPTEQRRLFAIILVHCAPTDVRIIWNIYFNTLYENFKRELGTSTEQHVFNALRSLSSFSESMDFF